MNTAVTKKFSVKPLVAAVALSVSAGTALAAPAPFQLMGHGLIVGLNPAATGFTSPGAQFLVSGAGGVNDQIFNGFTGLPGGIQIEGAGKVRGIIQWGGWDPATTNAGVDLELAFPFPNPAGFNIGQFAATTFTSGAGVTDAAILNIDASGSPSFIMGSLNSCEGLCPGGGGAGAAPRIFVSNMNGITVGPEANVVMPAGIGLIGANLNNPTARNDFLGNNGTGDSFIDITDGQSRVEQNGFIAGDSFVNAPAPFVLLAGGDIVNTGTIFGTFVETFAGMRAVNGKATVNLVPNTIVNRAWDVDADFYAFATLGLGATGGVEIASTSSVVNTGSISVTTPGFGYFLSLSSAGFRNGTQGNTDASIGIFADEGIFIENYTSASAVQIFNSVKGYDVNVVLPFLQINNDGGAHVPGSKGDVLIEALTVGTLPSSVTTTNIVAIWGDNVTINSTINHKLNSAGGVQLNVDLDITGTKSVTINKAIGAGHDVNIDATGPITTAVGGDILSDTNKAGGGGINIVNDGNQSGNLTLIAGNLATSTASGDDINVFNNGIASSKITISGNVTSHNGGDVAIYSDGNLELSGIILGDDDVSLTALGSSVVLKGPITADVGGDNGFFTRLRGECQRRALCQIWG
jgi:hypothetical protein